MRSGWADSKFAPAREHVERIKAFRRSRDMTRLRAGLAPVLECVKIGSGNLLALTIDAFEAGATMGDIAGVFRLGLGQPFDPFGRIASPL
jgi:methylmalonyl-CoA mutase N-terminal domain/subunit